MKQKWILLCSVQPLKINIEDAQVDNINYILVNRHDKEDLMKNLFVQTRQTTPNMIAYLMADFRSKQALGKHQVSRFIRQKKATRKCLI